MPPNQLAAFTIATYLVALILVATQGLFIPNTGLLKGLWGLFFRCLYTPEIWVASMRCFLALLWPLHHEKMQDMGRYLFGRKTLPSLLILLIYLGAILALAQGYHYPRFSLLLVLFIILFPQ